VVTGTVDQQQDVAASQQAPDVDESAAQLPTRESKHGDGGSFTPLPVDSLRRVLDGLRRLT
jgi:hypothetical protein